MSQSLADLQAASFLGMPGQLKSAVIIVSTPLELEQNQNYGPTSASTGEDKGKNRGGKKTKRYKKTQEGRREIPTIDECDRTTQFYARVTKMLGGERYTVLTMGTDKEFQALKRNSLNYKGRKRKNIITVGSVVLISPLDFETSSDGKVNKAIILEVYDTDEVRFLTRGGHIPRRKDATEADDDENDENKNPFDFDAI